MRETVQIAFHVTGDEKRRIDCYCISQNITIVALILQAFKVMGVYVPSYIYSSVRRKELPADKSYKDQESIRVRIPKEVNTSLRYNMSIKKCKMKDLLFDGLYKIGVLK